MSAYPPVLSEAETIARAAAGASLARLGDGELRLAVGGAAISQTADARLAAEMKALLTGKHKDLLACIPNATVTNNQGAWAAYTQKRYVDLYTGGPYGSAFVTRPDSAPWIDTPEYWQSVRDLWKGAPVCLVRGDDKSLTPAMLEGAAKVREVTGPRVNAYAAIDSLEEQIGKTAELVILCLGATATALAARLARKGMYALDLGHVGMFMRHAGAYRFLPADLVSPAYRDQLRAKHGTMRWGKDGHSHAVEVLGWAEATQSRTILDYGSGAGTLAQALAPRRVFEYDPGIKGKDALPKPADLIACTDVMEHVEGNRVQAVLQHALRLAGRAGYFVISLRPARELLPNGRNAHLTVQTADWWRDQVEQAGWIIDRAEVRKGLVLWLRK